MSREVESTKYCAFVTFKDGTTDFIPNVSETIFEWLGEEFDADRQDKTLYFSRTDGATIMKRDNIVRIDVVKDDVEESA